MGVLSSRYVNKKSNAEIVSFSFNSVKSNFSSSALKGLLINSIDEKIGFLSSVNDRIRKYDKVMQVDASVVEKAMGYKYSTLRVLRLKMSVFTPDQRQ